jgi:hypothetical protein
MATLTAEAQDIEAKIADAAIVTEALARQYFGDAAYLRRDVHEDRETGEEQVVFEVHDCFPDPENDFDRLAELHNAFFDSFVRATSRDILYRIVLNSIPSDVD